jgi:type VI protein secretion system component Hcp
MPHAYQWILETNWPSARSNSRFCHHRWSDWHHRRITVRPCPYDPTSGRVNGKKAPKPFVIVKDIDRATTSLHTALNNAEPITNFSLDYWRPATSSSMQLFYTVKLINAMIVSIATKQWPSTTPSRAVRFVRPTSLKYCNSASEATGSCRRPGVRRQLTHQSSLSGFFVIRQSRLSGMRKVNGFPSWEPRHRPRKKTAPTEEIRVRVTPPNRTRKKIQA